MEDHQKIESTLKEVFSSHSLILAILSNPKKGQLSSKITIRPVTIKNKNLLSHTNASKQDIYYQITESQKVKTSHRNLTANECLQWLIDQLVFFKQFNIYTKSADYHILLGKKGNITFLKKPSTKTSLTSDHNRQKNYLLQEGQPIPFLVYLGVMSKEGNVYAAKRDKFRQINRFVEIIQDVLPHFDPHQTLRIVDFGCGKAYLTFALYHYLKISKGYHVHITGLDLKEELIQQCEQLAHSLGYEQDLQFIQGDIKDYQTQEKVDIMISLHACKQQMPHWIKQYVGRQKSFSVFLVANMNSFLK